MHGNSGKDRHLHMDPDEERASTVITLKELGPRHKQVLSLLAQGVDRQAIAAIVDYTPEYVTWLARQPICQVYLKECSEFVDTQLLSLGGKAVQAINDALDNGTHDAKLRAAKLQLEATGKIGKFREQGVHSPSEERLERLSNRLLDLLRSQRAVITLEGQAITVNEEEEDGP